MADHLVLDNELKGSSLGKAIFPLSVFLSLPAVLCLRVRSLTLTLAFLLELSFRSRLGNHIAEVSWPFLGETLPSRFPGPSLILLKLFFMPLPLYSSVML